MRACVIAKIIYDKQELSVVMRVVHRLPKLQRASNERRNTKRRNANFYETGRFFALPLGRREYNTAVVLTGRQGCVP